MTDMHHLASVNTGACRHAMTSGLKKFASLKIADKIITRDPWALMLC